MSSLVDFRAVAGGMHGDNADLLGAGRRQVATLSVCS